jgi:hypothetical protein
MIATGAVAQQPVAPPIYRSTAPTNTAAVPTPLPAAPAANAPNAANAAAPASPPSAAAERSASDLEKLVAPIALYPDPLIATLLPASAYPLEIVQAARFVKDTNNISKLDAQPWDQNVKAIARFPEVVNQMNDNIAWTSDLGDAFINQPKEVMDAIQTMRGKAKDSGALKTTPQQVVSVTNTVIANTVNQQTVYVTNQIVQIQPAQPDVIAVPQYNPTVVYAGYPVVYPSYYYPPPPPYGYTMAASAISFGIGVTMGAIWANNCDWHGGGCYHSDVDINVDRDVNRERNVNRGDRNGDRVNPNNRGQGGGRGQKWQPDQNRLKNSGSKMSSTQSREARGWSSGAGSASARNTAASRPAGSAGAAGNRASQPSINRPSSQPSVNRPSSGQGMNRPSSQPSANRPSASQGANRGSSSQRSAFSGGGGGGSGARQASSRGAASRGGGGRGGGGRR